MDGMVLSSDRSNNPFLGSIITLDFHPFLDLLLIGTMDESHALVQLTEETPDKVQVNILQKWHDHHKYVVRVKWSPSGTIFATASHDRTVSFYSLNIQTMETEPIKKINFSGAVEAIEWLKDGTQLIVSVRDDAFLHYVNINNWEQILTNMNSLGDDYVSFTGLEIKLSPSGDQLVVCTDNSRALLFKTGTGIQSRVLTGFKNDGMSQPRVTFDNQNLLYVTSQDTKLYVFDLTSDFLVTTLSGHDKIIRDIKYDFKTDTLVTVSYDTTIKIWEREKF
eukprot:TRINITY_DN1949_c0_g1_i5.p1 TRINITY_DN1949_c0_g1~~TRINITY_DN1949_c0_g1_i5.p1  ORF type:complete len:278 (+),score=38.81 TRINITY_DN1949_c0_g1_i5:202-1035(+)